MWDFVLKFRLPEGGEDPSAWLDALFEADCDDATIGVGKRGSIALDFTRGGASAEDAVRSAIAAVKCAIPGAVLTEVCPESGQPHRPRGDAGMLASEPAEIRDG